MKRWISLLLVDIAKLPLSVGDVRHVRLADGGELDAIWSNGTDSSFCFFRMGEDGEATGVGLDVAAVQEPTRKYGNRSGGHTNPRRKLSAPLEAWELMDQCAGHEGESWNDWARGALALAVAQQLKLDEAETVDLFDRER